MYGAPGGRLTVARPTVTRLAARLTADSTAIAGAILPTGWRARPISDVHDRIRAVA